MIGGRLTLTERHVWEALYAMSDAGQLDWQYRPLHHPVNLRLAQAENQKASSDLEPLFGVTITLPTTDLPPAHDCRSSYGRMMFQAGICTPALRNTHLAST